MRRLRGAVSNGARQYLFSHCCVSNLGITRTDAGFRISNKDISCSRFLTFALHVGSYASNNNKNGIYLERFWSEFKEPPLG